MSMFSCSFHHHIHKRGREGDRDLRLNPIKASASPFTISQKGWWFLSNWKYYLIIRLVQAASGTVFTMSGGNNDDDGKNIILYDATFFLVLLSLQKRARERCAFKRMKSTKWMIAPS
jgi:hypothetical protein